VIKNTQSKNANAVGKLGNSEQVDGDDVDICWLRVTKNYCMMWPGVN
jgi:hypothetical protein